MLYCDLRNHLGNNCIQHFHLGRYIIGNLVLQPRASGAVKRDFRPYIRQYTSPNENFEYGYPHSNALLQYHLKLERWKPHKAAHHPTKFDIINDVKQFATVYRRIYRHKFLRLSNHQKSLCKNKCIRILHHWWLSNLWTAYDAGGIHVNTLQTHLVSFCRKPLPKPQKGYHLATELDTLLSTYREGELEAIVEMAMHLKENATDVNDALNEVENYLQILKNLSIEVQ